MRLLLYILLLNCTVIFPYTVQAGQVVDRVVAVVNEDVITLSEVNEEGEPVFRRIYDQLPADQSEDAIKTAQKEILSKLIDRLLISQRGRERHIEVSDAEVDAAIERILIKNDITLEQLKSDLAQAGTNETNYRNTIRNQILRSKLVSYEIHSKIVITDNQIQEYYNKRYSNIKSEDGYHLLQFGFMWGKKGRSSTPEEAKARAQQIHDMVVSGENFKNLAKEYSDLPSSSDGGDIGVFSKEELAPYMWEAIQHLKPGEISEVIATPSAYQFFKLQSSKRGNVIVQAPLESVREEIRTQLYDQELEDKFDIWVKQLREQSYIEELL